MLKRSLIVRSLALAVAAVSLCAHTSAVQAAGLRPIQVGGGATAQVDAQQIQVNQRPPLPFKPFPLADLRTGQPLAPGAIITLKNGKQMRADAYFAEINRLEQQFNAMGYTLRQPGVFKLQAMKVDQQQLQAQAAMLPTTPAPSGKMNLISGAQFARTAAVSPRLRVVIPGNLFTSSGANMGKSWSYNFGSTDTLGAGFSGEINVNGSTNGLNANGVARASGAILGNQWDLLRVTGSLDAPKGANGSAKVNLYVVGIGDVPVLNQSLPQSGANISNGTSRNLDVHADFDIPVGPFVVSARLGVRGNAGVQYGMNLNSSGIGASLKPTVNVDAYGQGGISIGVAEGGIGCDLTLLSNSLNLGATGGITTDAAGNPALSAHCYGYDNLVALSGRLYAYAKVDLLFWDDEWDFDIWNFAGIKRNFTLFDEQKTVSFTPQLPVFTVAN
jgi:hypothetical protein